MSKKREIWIVQGIVTDADAHAGRADIGDTEWQFSDGPSGERGSSADYLSIEEGMMAHPDCVFYFDPLPDPEATIHIFTVEFRVPQSELEDCWRVEQQVFSPNTTMAKILQRDLYDSMGMSGEFVINTHQAPTL
jgi:hypothetical protein